MLLLEQAAYPAAQFLLKDFSSTHVAIAAVLDGIIKGEVWVDRPVEPRVALLANGDAYYLAGLPDEAGDSFADLKELIPDWAYFFVEGRWSDRLGDIWSNGFARPHPLVRMGLPGASHGLAATMLPDGFRLVPIDQRLLDLESGNIETVTDLMEG
ncbi:MULTISPECIES: hypothetical protein [Ensifer]|uniref:Uncharacterized protein n=1 Tax=Ensifer adhaerens TaxID=106592 RepID=A0ABY8HLV0_ENSAD|nr:MULTISPECIES: hypothetical protein [Ensifer]ANK75873.1 hypothetical protein FA04_24770 [Ensifer adhaerens]KDP72398.1 hypothetical protein FA04_17880 [Ensifer adhaerens]KQZ53290.1 hypothetical protein ASD63_29190 [Ensifer sp. Root558]WFP93028.1 hypothetical protein P4B07_25095 [Ensifer adhaerens]SFH03080.1 hypothetical protein SAMN05216459_11471 [Ensifer sp. OV372]